MKKLLLLMMAVGFVNGAYAQDSESETDDKRNGLDTLVVSKVVRWSSDVGPGEVADSYGNSANYYGITGTRGSSTSPAGDQDTLSINITDVEKEMQISNDTAYFYHAVDPNDVEFRDSVFVTRFTEYLDTKSETNENYQLTLRALMGGTLKIYAAPRKKNSEDVEITVKQNDHIVLQGTVSSTPTEKASVNLSAFDDMEIMGYVISQGINNYNLTNPPTSSSSSSSSSSSTPTEVSCFRPLVSTRAVGPGELTIEYPKSVRIYGVELVQILGREDEQAALVEYPGKERMTKHNVSNEFVKLKDGTNISCIEFENDYTATDYYLEIIPPAGFKKNDVVRIAGVYDADGNAQSQLDLFQIIGETPDIVLTTNPLVNASTVSAVPDYESIVLTRAYDRLYIGRTKGSSSNPMLTNLRVEGERTYEEMQEPTGIQERIVKFEIDFTKPFYNLKGQRVGNDYKGVVIQNGIKMIRH